MKTYKSSIPKESLISSYLPADYSDVYQCQIALDERIIPDDVMVRFWTDFPTWVNALFKLRNFLGKFVGLKSSEGGNLEEFEKCIRTGKAYGFVSVPAKNENETVLLLTDKHLNAYLSIYVECGKEYKKVFAITLVHFKNKLGHVYFFIIRPFHGIIVRSMLKRAISTAIHE